MDVRHGINSSAGLLAKKLSIHTLRRPDRDLEERTADLH